MPWIIRLFVVLTLFTMQSATADWGEGWDPIDPADADCSLIANDLDGDGIGDNFESALPYIPWGETGSDVADRWRAAEIAALQEAVAHAHSTENVDKLGDDGLHREPSD